MASPTKQSFRNNPGVALVRKRWLAHRTVHEGQILFWRSLRPPEVGIPSRSIYLGLEDVDNWSAVAWEMRRLVVYLLNE